MNTQSPPPTPPRLYRLNFAAHASGMTADAFLAASQAGQIPVTCVQIGAGKFWHVDAIQWLRWMGPLAPEGLTRLFPEL